MSAPTCIAVESPAPERKPVPMTCGRLCAWCFPGVDWPTGHGICEPCKGQLLAESLPPKEP